MSDERMGDALIPAIRALPRGAGVIFRHYGLEPDARRTLFRRVQRLARHKGLILILAGDEDQARAWRADGFHGRDRGHHNSLHSAPAHNLREVRQARRNRAGLILLSPLHPTRSHPDAQGMGAMRFAAIARHASVPVVALGGMTRARGHRAMQLGAYGWAAIDALTPVGGSRR